jgi:hypothetical protein
VINNAKVRLIVKEHSLNERKLYFNCGGTKLSFDKMTCETKGAKFCESMLCILTEKINEGVRNQSFSQMV